MAIKELSPKARNLMILEVLEQGQQIADVAKKYGVSRVTLYKWLKRREEEIKNSGEVVLVNKE
jgi:transposase-like protein